MKNKKNRLADKIPALYFVKDKDGRIIDELVVYWCFKVPVVQSGRNYKFFEKGIDEVQKICHIFGCKIENAL